MSLKGLLQSLCHFESWTFLRHGPMIDNSLGVWFLLGLRKKVKGFLVERGLPELESPLHLNMKTIQKFKYS
jgi:hypothetical protein